MKFFRPPGIYDVDARRARTVTENVQKEMSIWLVGLKKQLATIVKGGFTLIKYTDSLDNTAKLKQPNGLIYGPTGTGKTDGINSFFMSIQGTFSRIQGEPTVLPNDIIGEDTLAKHSDGSFEIKFIPGPLISNGILLDEGNRMLGNTKAVFAEAGEESAVTLKSPYQGRKKIPLFPVSGDINDINGPRFFMMLTTQNIFGEEEGTFENPMMELDRYCFNIFMGYPEKMEEEMKVSAYNFVGKKIEPVTNLLEVLSIAHHIFENVTIPDRTRHYLVSLIRNTRPTQAEGRAKAIAQRKLAVGASTRVNLHFEAFARTEAFFCGDKAVRPEHIKNVAEAVLTHRLIPQEGVGMSSDNLNKSKEEICSEILKEIIEATPIPPRS